MWMKELFEKHNVTPPEWLSDEMLDDEWEDSIYSIINNSHKWVLKTPIQNMVLLFDGETCILRGFDDGDVVIFEKIITADETLIS